MPSRRGWHGSLLLGSLTIILASHQAAATDIRHEAWAAFHDGNWALTERLTASLPNDPSAVLLRAVAASRAGDVALARRILEDGTRRFPDDQRFFVDLAITLAAENKDEEAIRTIEGFLEARPDIQTAFQTLRAIQGRAAREAYGRALGIKLNSLPPLELIEPSLPPNDLVLAEKDNAGGIEPPSVRPTPPPLVPAPPAKPSAEAQTAAAPTETQQTVAEQHAAGDSVAPPAVPAPPAKPLALAQTTAVPTENRQTVAEPPHTTSQPVAPPAVPAPPAKPMALAQTTAAPTENRQTVAEPPHPTSQPVAPPAVPAPPAKPMALAQTTAAPTENRQTVAEPPHPTSQPVAPPAVPAPPAKPVALAQTAAVPTETRQTVAEPPHPTSQPVAPPAVPAPSENRQTVAQQPHAPAIAAANTPGPKPAPADNGATANSDEAAVRARTAAWAEAWQSRDFERYRSFYARGFAQLPGETAEAWVTRRRTVLAGAGTIHLTLHDIVVRRQAKEMSASFRQAYDAPGIRLETWKTLVWEKQGDAWVITHEIVEKEVHG
jgi:hypothetical protein